jgi:hypothetical protein
VGESDVARYRIERRGKIGLRKSNVLQGKMGIPLIEGAVARRGYQVRIPEKSQENNTFYRKNKESRDK